LDGAVEAPPGHRQIRASVAADRGAEFAERAQEAEPVVADIVRDGVALVGRKPVFGRGAA